MWKMVPFKTMSFFLNNIYIYILYFYDCWKVEQERFQFFPVIVLDNFLVVCLLGDPEGFQVEALFLML